MLPGATPFYGYGRAFVKSKVRMLLLAAPMGALACSYHFHSVGVAKPLPQEAGYLYNLTMTSKFISSDFTPDGDLAKSVWRDAPRVKFDRDVRAEKPFPDSETQVASLWTPDYVYLGYRCTYRTLNVYEGEDIAQERYELWNRDTAEAFINPAPERFNHYYEFEVAPNNQWVDLEIDLTKTPFGNVGWDSHFAHATKIDAQNHVWTAEMKIPVKSMGAKALQPGAAWRLNLYRLDGPGDDTQRHFLSWSPLPPGKNQSFHQPASFGIIKFIQ
jgi:hypothetical protein